MAKKCTEEQRKSTADKVRKLTEELKTKMEELFESEMYKKYLSFMGKFHQYSWNNSLLILIQMPTAELVAGYSTWKKMGRYVKAGQKGITIFAPVPHKKSVEKKDRDGKPVIGRDGHTETEEILIPGYKTATVFDVSQTDGKELPTLGCKELTGSVEYYEDMIEAIYSISQCPITEEEISGGAKGFFAPKEFRIAVQKGMSEVQTTKTLIHELAHAKLHNLEADKEERKDRNTMEVEAESIAYTVCSAFDIDTSDYSFSYLAGWSSGKEMRELKGSMATIQKTAAEIIDGIHDWFEKKEAERERDLLIRAMEAAEYEYDTETAEHVRFLYTGQYQTGNDTMEFDSWVDVREWLDGVVFDDPEKSDQVEVLLHPEHFERIAEIYQLKDEESVMEYRFEPLERLHRRGLRVEYANYDRVYTYPLPPDMGLDGIYEKFNLDCPANFYGHSLSVSDMILIINGNDRKAYYVDAFGFTEIDLIRQGDTYIFTECGTDQAVTGKMARESVSTKRYA